MANSNYRTHQILSHTYNLVNPNHLQSYHQLLNEWPMDLNYPLWTVTYPRPEIYSCFPYLYRLPITSMLSESPMFLKLPICTNENDLFIAKADVACSSKIFLNETDYESRFINLIVEEYLEKSYFSYSENCLSEATADDLDTDLFTHHTAERVDQILYDRFPEPILCRCKRPVSVSPTSGTLKIIKGIGAGCYSAFNFISFNNNESQIVDIIENWTLDIINLGVNFNLPTIIITFLKLFKNFMPISEFILKLVDIFTKLFGNMCNYLGKTASEFLSSAKTYFSPSSTQPSTEAEIELLSELDSGRVSLTSGHLDSMGFLEPILQYVAEKPVIATLMSSFVVISGGVILGNLSNLGNTKASPGDKIAKSFYNISKVERGATSTIHMIQNFNTYLTDYIMCCLGKTTNSMLLQAMDCVSIPDDESNVKSELFNYIDYLLNPMNKAEVTTSKALLKRLNFCISIIDQIHQKAANSEVYLPNQSLNYILGKVIELKKLRLFVVKYSPEPSYRITPFWLNIAGTPGTGKSAFVPFLVTSVLKTLQTKGGFDVNDQDSWTYPVNFTDKYLSKYSNHYCVTIDDLMQDTAPLGDRSSALDIISWVSCIPHYTNQADLESKGTPFTSKMIVSTTNDLSMANRKEIISTEALKRRIKVQAVMIKDTKAAKDPNLMEGVRIELRDSLTGGKIRDVTSTELIAYVITEFMKHYNHEQTLMGTREPSADFLNEVASLVSPTSGLVNWCKWGLNPSLKYQHLFDATGTADIMVYDCDCSKHAKINDDFITHCFSLLEDNQDYLNLSIRDFGRQVEADTASALAEINLYQKTKSIVYDMYLKIIDTFDSQLIFKAIAAAAGALAVYSTYKYFSKSSLADDYSDLDPELSAAQYDKGKPSRTRTRLAQPFRRIPNKFVPTDVVATNGVGSFYQANGIDEQANQLIKNIAINGSVVRLLHLETGMVNTAIMIRGSYMLTNHHYFAEFEEGDEFAVYTNMPGSEAVVNQTFTKSKLIRIEDLDAAIYQCDTAVLSRYKSIVKHFLKSEEMPTVDAPAVVMTALPSFQTIVNLNAKPLTCNVPYQNESKTEHYRLLKSFVINHQVEFGQSGSLLIGLNKIQTRKFLGIQTCRDNATKLGYFVPITEEQLLHALDQFNDKLNYEIKVNEIVTATCGKIDDRCPPNLAHNSLKYVGTVGKTRFVKPQLRTKIIPSLVQNPESLTQEPSVLFDFDTRMKASLQGTPVIFRAIQGFDNQIGTLDRNILMKAVDELAMDYNFSISHPLVKREVLTNFETINGVPGLIKRIEMNSSPGWPYAVERQNTTKGGKEEWFAKMDNPPEGYSLAYLMQPTLMSGLKRRENLAKQGRNDLTVSYVCLKDETRPLAKIEEGKTRAFICLPMDYNLLVKKYFGAFTATQHLLAGQISSCVGIDPATKWKVLFDRLNEKNMLWEDFDYQNWDQHLHPELVYQVARIINKWYGDDDNSENGLVRRVLILDLIHTTLIVKDRLFIKSTGQCSGCAITAELNCIVHELLMYYVWIKLHQDHNLTTDIEEFRQQVAMALYGDDILLAVDNPRIKFNGLTIKPIMEKLGMGITPGNKLSTEFKVKKPSELEFLKRSFREEGNHVKAPLRTEVINNIYQWIHKSDNNIEATRTNCEAALQESYMHSREYFNKLLNELNSRIISYNRDNLIQINPIIKRYEDYDEKYRKSEFMCLGLAETSVKP